MVRFLRFRLIARNGTHSSLGVHRASLNLRVLPCLISRETFGDNKDWE